MRNLDFYCTSGYFINKHIYHLEINSKLHPLFKYNLKKMVNLKSLNIDIEDVDIINIICDNMLSLNALNLHISNYTEFIKTYDLTPIRKLMNLRKIHIYCLKYNSNYIQS